ncbi:hypothetical protein GCM10010389_25390 [Streptomyces echinoruber]|uniref:Uncharacterized protein n=1 Tax=Streptomyces echinoruber TaxID=68898 RepID=A0A918R5F4_9ACTN|nr:hypothetical protein GCM10010389_25390 [Streptomyces echinoruber]
MRVSTVTTYVTRPILAGTCLTTGRNPLTRYALVPSSSVKAVERVPAHVHKLLRIDVYEVTDNDVVRRLPTQTGFCSGPQCPQGKASRPQGSRSVLSPRS